MRSKFTFTAIIAACCLLPSFLYAQVKPAAGLMKLNAQEYLEYKGINVMLAYDFYPEGHQGGVGIIQNGQRVATNGDIRLEPTPGQWSPIPKVGKRVVNKATGEVKQVARCQPEIKVF